MWLTRGDRDVKERMVLCLRGKPDERYVAIRMRSRSASGHGTTRLDILDRRAHLRKQSATVYRHRTGHLLKGSKFSLSVPENSVASCGINVYEIEVSPQYTVVLGATHNSRS